MIASVGKSLLIFRIPVVPFLHFPFFIPLSPFCLCMLSSLCSSLGRIHTASSGFLPSLSKDSLRGKRLSSLSRDHVSGEEAGPDIAECKSEKLNERAELKKEEEKGGDAPGGTKEVRSDESYGTRSGRGEGKGSEDARTESQEVEEEEQTTGSDRLSEHGDQSSPSPEAELCRKQTSPNAKEKPDSEVSFGSYGDNSFMSDHEAASAPLAGLLESKKAQEYQDEERKDGYRDSETDRAGLDEGSDPSEPHSAAGESGQRGDEVCAVGPGKTLDRGGRKPSGEMKTVMGRPSPSAEVGLGVVRKRTPIPCFPFADPVKTS